MRCLLTLLLLCLTCLPRAWAQSMLPDLGDASSNVLSPQMERRIGESIARDIRQRDPDYVDDPELSEYLTSLGGKLTSASRDIRSDFEFFAIRDPSINAFALPGGFIGVNTGLITAADTESEIASVLAHEISHVTQRHIARQFGQQQQAQLPTMVAMVAAIIAARSRPDLASGAAMAAQGSAIASQLGYSRDFEREADRIGFQTMTSAGFDPRGMSAFFEKLQRTHRIMDDGSAPGYLRTHPLTLERISEAQNRAQTAGYRQHVDSLEFHLLRAKLRAQSGDSRDAVNYFRAVVRDGRYANEAAARYGLVSALFRNKELSQAQAEFNLLRALAPRSPMIETLSARLLAASGDSAGALAQLRQGLQRFPYSRALSYALTQTLMDAGRVTEGMAMITEQIRLYPRDPQLLALRARGFAMQGKRLLQHQTLAEYQVLQGNLALAVEQLQLAQTAGDGDFYELSVVDARLKQLRAQLAAEMKQRRDSR